MIAQLSRLKTHFANWREWELNPVVIKELRQAVRSWAVTGMLLLFLIVLFITSIIFLVNQSFEITVNERLGGEIFQAILVILAGASILFIPLYVGIRMAAERVENNTDLLYISTLSPARIIRGKFFCGAYVTLLFFSACMPFMAFTNLLRGVDLPTVFFILAFLFVVVCAANQLAIFIACLPLSRPFKVLLALIGLGLSFWIVGMVVLGSYAMMRSGIGSMMVERMFWNIVITVGTITSAAGGLFFVLSVALISPLSANRALLPRIYITALWVVGALLAGVWAWHENEPGIIFVWTYISTTLLIASLIVTVSNYDQLSIRVQRTIPGSGLKRMLAFLFFNGAAGGLVWIGSLVALTYFATLFFLCIAPTSSRGFTITPTIENFETQYPPLLIYLFAYALTALFIQRKFLPRHSPKLAGLFSLLVAVLAAIGPAIVLFFINQLSWKTLEHLQLGNAFNLFVRTENGERMTHLYFALGWLVITLILNAKWFFAQIKKFRPRPDNMPPRIG